VPQVAGECDSWITFGFPDDLLCMGGASPTAQPGALIRGGSFLDEQLIGVFYVDALNEPTSSDQRIGFRCGR